MKRSLLPLFLFVAAACSKVESAPPEPLVETTSEDRVTVGLYKSDSCSSDLVAVVSTSTDCASLGSGRVWGVKVGTQCFDISDTEAVAACTRFRGAASTESIAIYHSDSCATGDLLAHVDERSDCAALAAMISSNAWGVSINGTCTDIPDTSFASACNLFRTQVPGGVELFKSDSCSSDLIASIGPGTDCDGLAAATSARVWAVRFGGACHDISDTDAKRACEVYKAAGGEGSVPLFHSDACAAGELVGIVGPSTNCAAFSSIVTTNIWGITIDGACSDITDMSSLNACTRFGGAGGGTSTTGVAVFDNDGCSGAAAASLTPTTDCTALAARVSASARAVRVAGACANIRDTTMLDVCNRYRDVDP